MERLVYCSISNEPASNPILCSRTGYIFNKETIKVYLEKSNNKCPMTQMELNFPSDFVEIHALEGPTLNTNSAASRLKKLGGVSLNYNELMEEARIYKKTINILNKKLVASLKMQKAGLSLIKQLKADRDDAREMLLETDYDLVGQKVEKLRQDDDHEKLFNEIKKNALRLNSVRKQIAKAYMNQDSIFLREIKNKKQKEIAFELSEFDPRQFKILAHPFNSDIYIASNKGYTTVVFDFDSLIAKKVYDVSFQRYDHILTSSFLTPESQNELGYILAMNDGNIQTGILNATDGKCEICSTRNLETNFVDLEEHPLDRLLVGLDEFRNISIYDLAKEVIYSTTKIEDDLEFNVLSIHPDGKLVALGGSNSNLHFFDLSSNQLVLTLESVSVSYLNLFLG